MALVTRRVAAVAATRTSSEAYGLCVAVAKREMGLVPEKQEHLLSDLERANEATYFLRKERELLEKLAKKKRASRPIDNPSASASASSATSAEDAARGQAPL